MQELFIDELNKELIDNAFSFYNIDEIYKERAYNCLQEILGNELFKKKFLEIYEVLFLRDSDEFRELWKIKDIEVLFGSGVHPFVTNLMILFGMTIHKDKMKEMGFSKKQINSHKARVKDCFKNDLEKRGYNGIRVSQMLWASYFINCRIIEVGILQFEFDASIDKIKIHIPPMSKLEFDKVKQSLIDSKREIEKYFHFHDKQYICNSWLLSKQLIPLLDDKSNIKQFQTLFSIEDDEDCLGDILNHVFNLKDCKDLRELPEKTSLQKKIKYKLMEGYIFRLGCGELNKIISKDCDFEYKPIEQIKEF